MRNKAIIITMFLLLTGVDAFSRSGRSTHQDKRPIDWVEYHSNFLHSKNITDLTNEGLIALVENTKDTSVAYHSILLLGRKGIKKAIPAIELWLNKKNITVQTAAAEAFLMLGSNNSIGRLKKICRENDNIYALDAAGVLARYGFVDAIPYLEKFGKSKVYSHRLSALGHMKNLAEKLDKGAATDKKNKQVHEILIGNILKLSSDKDIRVQKRALMILKTMNVKDKELILEGLKELEAN